MGAHPSDPLKVTGQTLFYLFAEGVYLTICHDVLIIRLLRPH